EALGAEQGRGVGSGGGESSASVQVNEDGTVIIATGMVGPPVALKRETCGAATVPGCCRTSKFPTGGEAVPGPCRYRVGAHIISNMAITGGSSCENIRASARLVKIRCHSPATGPKFRCRATRPTASRLLIKKGFSALIRRFWELGGGFSPAIRERSRDPQEGQSPP